MVRRLRRTSGTAIIMVYGSFVRGSRRANVRLLLKKKKQINRYISRTLFTYWRAIIILYGELERVLYLNRGIIYTRLPRKTKEKRRQYDDDDNTNATNRRRAQFGVMTSSPYRVQRSRGENHWMSLRRVRIRVNSHVPRCGYSTTDVLGYTSTVVWTGQQ